MRVAVRRRVRPPRVAVSATAVSVPGRPSRRWTAAAARVGTATATAV